MLNLTKKQENLYETNIKLQNKMILKMKVIQEKVKKSKWALSTPCGELMGITPLFYFYTPE